MQMTKLSKDQKLKVEQARALFFAGYEVSDCAQIIDLPLDFVRTLVFGADQSGREQNCWYKLREAMGPASVAAFVHSKKDVLDRVTGTAANILSVSLDNLRNKVLSGEVVLNISELKQLSSIVVDMDKIVRLESGKATEIINNVGLTPEQAREMLKKDPFAKMIVPEYTVKDVKEEVED